MTHNSFAIYPLCYAAEFILFYGFIVVFFLCKNDVVVLS